jgi:hypothetical protein
MVKQGAINTGWKKRWFVLGPNTLSYYKDMKDMKSKGKQLGSIPLDGCYVERDPSKELALRLVHPERRIYYFAPLSQAHSLFVLFRFFSSHTLSSSNLFKSGSLPSIWSTSSSRGKTTSD